MNYLFKSARLGFRNWSLDDLPAFAEMNADLRVMEHFPSTLDLAKSESLLQRMRAHFDEHGYTYYAVETLENSEFIGFIGLAKQNYASPYTPATDIGWRLKPSAWGHGYATEGAKRCLKHAFDDLSLSKVIAVCTIGNRNSEGVMKKLGMEYLGQFSHPDLADYPELGPCRCYVKTSGDMSQFIQV